MRSCSPAQRMARSASLLRHTGALAPLIGALVSHPRETVARHARLRCVPRRLHARCVVSEASPHGGASCTGQRAQVHENIGSLKPLSRSWAGTGRWRATPCERPTRIPLASCTLHQRWATRLRNLRHSNVGCAWRSRIHGCGVAVACGKRGILGRIGRGSGRGGGPSHWPSPWAATGRVERSLARPSRKLPPVAATCSGRIGRPRPAGSAGRARAGRYAVGRVGRPPPVESVCTRSNRPSSCGRIGL